MDNNIKKTADFHFDVVFCLDINKRNQVFFDEFKRGIKTIYQDFYKEYTECYCLNFDQLRIKIITFDSSNLMESKFFTLPKDDNKLMEFVNGIKLSESEGPSLELEALSLAIDSDWTTPCIKDGVELIANRIRQCIVMLSSSMDVKELKYNNHPIYSNDLRELMDRWEYGYHNYNCKAGRLIAFVPNTYPWGDMLALNRYWPAFSKDLSSVDFSSILSLLCGEM